MDTILEKLKSLLSIFGMKLDMFPGIPIVLIPLYFFINHYREEVLNVINASQLNENAQTSLILIIILILGISLWRLSGYILDPLYDNLAPSKTKSNSDLNIHIIKAREKWISRNSIYQNENVPIYKDTINELKEKAPKIYNNIRLTLSASKFFRILVIPFIALAISKFISKEYVIGVFLIAITLLFLIISFSYRAEQSRDTYNWFINQKE